MDEGDRSAMAAATAEDAARWASRATLLLEGATFKLP